MSYINHEDRIEQHLTESPARFVNMLTLRGRLFAESHKTEKTGIDHGHTNRYSMAYYVTATKLLFVMTS